MAAGKALVVDRTALAKTARVKSLDFHATESLLLVGTFDSRAEVYDYATSALVSSVKLRLNDDKAVRAVRFVPGTTLYVCGADDGFVRVFDRLAAGPAPVGSPGADEAAYASVEAALQYSVRACSDFVRSIALHPAGGMALTAGDDNKAKLWSFGPGAGGVSAEWAMERVYEGHAHYVMSARFCPADPNIFATAGLDSECIVWSLGSSRPSRRLAGHSQGLNSVEFAPASLGRPWLVTAADDRTVRVLDYTTGRTVFRIAPDSGAPLGFGDNVNSAMFHPRLPILVTACEDCSVRVWRINARAEPDPSLPGNDGAPRRRGGKGAPPVLLLDNPLVPDAVFSSSAASKQKAWCLASALVTRHVEGERGGGARSLGVAVAVAVMVCGFENGPVMLAFPGDGAADGGDGEGVSRRAGWAVDGVMEDEDATIGRGKHRRQWGRPRA